MNYKKKRKAIMNTLARRLAEEAGLGSLPDRPDTLSRALAMLPPPDLLMLLWRYGTGVDARTIAKRLGVTAEYVTQSNERAIRRLKRELHGPDPDEFDEEFVADTFGPMPPAAKTAWEKANRKPGRPKVGRGSRVISVSLEKGLLARCDALAERLGMARSALIADGLRSMLAHVEDK